MAVIPLIVGFGGVNASGRSSFHHGFNRTVIDALSADKQARTWDSLRALTGATNATNEALAANSLIREIELDHFDHNAVTWNRDVPFDTSGSVISIPIKRMPAVVPDNWEILSQEDNVVKVRLEGTIAAVFKDKRVCEVGSAGMVPTGFDAGKLYPSRSHPRSLQLGLYAATDALGSMGLDWDTIASKIPPDQVSVYSGSCTGQMDSNGFGGMWARQRGKRVSSKNLALGLAQMPADFINAYVLGTAGSTGTVLGACATFHYNLRAAVNDIVSGRAKVAIAGGADGNINPEIIDGFHTMGALASKKGLRALDGTDTPDYRRACRPFGLNCGFTMAESAQTIVLMADDLALELGAQVFGTAADVFVNADGFKKSISGPGVGNHITVAKGAGLIKHILGEESLQQRSFVHAHGTGTPQNRVSESQIFNQVAQGFGIEAWPVAAIKCFLGHPLATAGGDQLVSALGSWNSGIIPGITTIDEVAPDVHQSHLSFSNKHVQREQGSIDSVLLNAKGFGGNNATSVVLSPSVSLDMMTKKHGKAAMLKWQGLAEQTQERAQAYDVLAMQGSQSLVYNFDHNVQTEANVSISNDTLSIDCYDNAVDLHSSSPLKQYAD